MQWQLPGSVMRMSQLVADTSGLHHVLRCHSGLTHLQLVQTCMTPTCNTTHTCHTVQTCHTKQAFHRKQHKERTANSAAAQAAC